MASTARAAGAASEPIEGLQEARERTLALVAPFSDADLERVHSTLMSPLVWDLGHIAAFEDLWLVHRYGQQPMLHQELVEVYDAMETPRARRGDLPFLRAPQARDYLEQVRARTLAVIDERGIGDGILHELVLRHEQQHNETMLQTLQLARLDPFAGAHHEPELDSTGSWRGASAPAGLEMVDVPGGECTVGAAFDPGRGSVCWRDFAYDNERPRHRTDVRQFQLGCHPITNASYLHFVEGGGYERREWWSDEGWAWKEQYDITRPGGWAADRSREWRLGTLLPLDPHRPVVHVSWFEADAFARSHGVRLPTELEWEKAATWDQETGAARRYPWGEEDLIAGVHANVDQLAAGPDPATSHPAGASPYGCEGMIGDVWEWTASEFAAYPGFVPYPYREYSEPFFGAGYKVLRGGSWATRARVATASFRNWDFPQRRQIFSGIRVAQ
jgi:gamma-glutamyl hercynylcysteine S-oxide synthase